MKFHFGCNHKISINLDKKLFYGFKFMRKFTKTSLNPCLEPASKIVDSGDGDL